MTTANPTTTSELLRELAMIGQRDHLVPEITVIYRPMKCDDLSHVYVNKQFIALKIPSFGEPLDILERERPAPE